MRKSLIMAALALLLSGGAVLASESEVGMSVSGGTLGGGIGGEVNLNDHFALRAGINYLKFDFDTTIGDLDYSMEPEFKNGGLLVDWFPFGGTFRLTGGVYINGNEIDVDGIYREDRIPLEYRQYSYLRELAHLKGKVEFNDVAPYLGLGWSSNRGQQGWGVALDVGVLFQGAPTVSDLRVEDPIGIGGLPEVQDFLEEQRRAIEDDLDNFQYYPVATLSVRYLF